MYFVGPLLLLTMAEYFAKNPLNISIRSGLLSSDLAKSAADSYFSIVITTGHMSGGHLNERLWMSERPSIRRNAKAAIICEHFGAIEWKDNFSTGKPVYQPTGNIEPMWTMAYVIYHCVAKKEALKCYVIGILPRLVICSMSYI